VKARLDIQDPKMGLASLCSWTSISSSRNILPW